MKILTMIIWIVFNVLLLTLLVKLYFETITGSYSWWYFWTGVILVCLVNITITLDQVVKNDKKIK